VVQKEFHDLVVSTYGRGIYILDDVSPLEQMAANKSDAAVRLFEPRKSYRFARNGGVFVTYALKSAPKDKRVQIEILDQQGGEVRKLNGPMKEGINRVEWDLHYDRPTAVALRTAAPENPHIWDEARFRGAESRPITHWGIEGAEVGPFAAPGKYTIRLTVDGQSYTQPITLVKDPRAPGSDADLESTLKVQLRIRDDINATSNMVNHLEWTRKQLGVVEQMLKSEEEQNKAKGNKENPQSADLLKSVGDMNKKLESVEYKLVSQSDLNSDDKYYVEPYKVYLNLIWLNGEIGTGAGDVAGGVDWAPTESDMNVLESIEKDLTAAKSDYKDLFDKDLPAFNRALAEHGISPMVAVPPSDESEQAAP
jgi:hypothetical protein